MNDGRGLSALTYGRPWVVMSVGFAEEHESMRRKEIPRLVTWVPALLHTSIIVFSIKIESKKVPVDIESNTGAKSRGSRSEEMEKKGHSSKRTWHSLRVKEGRLASDVQIQNWRITVTFAVTDNKGLVTWSLKHTILSTLSCFQCSHHIAKSSMCVIPFSSTAVHIGIVSYMNYGGRFWARRTEFGYSWGVTSHRFVHRISLSQELWISFRQIRCVPIDESSVVTLGWSVRTINSLLGSLALHHLVVSS